MLNARGEAAQPHRNGCSIPAVKVRNLRRNTHLIMLPPQYEQYLKYSKMARDIYLRYTNQVEQFGMDECWLDVSASRAVYGDGVRIAEEIRSSIRNELGMTVSIGVSFNKIFAKLGSDMKKPDAITVIGEVDYKEKVWPLPASELMYVGPATSSKLASYGIHTIGDIARTSPDFLKQLLGINGLAIWRYATGADRSRVMDIDYSVPVKSVGHGITCIADLVDEEEVWKVMLELSQDIGHKLRLYELKARGVQITIKNNGLLCKQYQTQLEVATQSPTEIALKARELFSKNYNWSMPVRAVTVRAISLIPADTPQQVSLFDDMERRKKRELLDDTVEDIRRRFGKRAIYSASLMGDLKMPGRGVHEVMLPGVMYE